MGYGCRHPQRVTNALSPQARDRQVRALLEAALEKLAGNEDSS